jgi:regulator of CtrA degradation
VKLASTDFTDEENVKLLPERLRALIERSKVLQSAVRRLDTTIHANAEGTRGKLPNPVERQLGLLKAAFEQDGV